MKEAEIRQDLIDWRDGEIESLFYHPEVKTYPTEDEVVLTGKASGGIEHA